MSETMKKRYEDVSATLCAIHGLKYSHCLTREEAEAIESLLDDLMAERGKKKLVNLDEIFPKEIMEKAVLFAAYHILGNGQVSQHASSREPVLQKVVDAAYHLKGKGEYDLVALNTRRMPTKELARVRVRLGLTVEIVEDK